MGQGTSVSRTFKRFHRGGSGGPLVCLHGFLDTWRCWELVLPALERRHDVVALAPAGGWAREDQSWRGLLVLQHQLHSLARQAAPQAELILDSREGRRQATRLITTNFKHIPPELLAHQMRGIAACTGAEAMIEHGLASDEWPLEADRVTCPARIVWGTNDLLLPWPNAAERYRRDWLPQADWIVLDAIGHCPQLDAPLETSELILGHTSPSGWRPAASVRLVTAHSRGGETIEPP